MIITAQGQGIGDSSGYRYTYNLLVKTAHAFVVSYNYHNRGSPCRIYNGSHDALLTHPNHIPIYFTDMVELFSHDPENEKFASEIVGLCELDGLNILICHPLDKE